MSQTLFEKIWQQHVVVDKGNEALLYIDRNLLHDGAFHAFAALNREGRKTRKPRQHLATADHYVPTRERDKGLASVHDADAREMLRLFDVTSCAYCASFVDRAMHILPLVSSRTCPSCYVPTVAAELRLQLSGHL